MWLCCQSHRQTDKWTDGQTDGQTGAILLSPCWVLGAEVVENASTQTLQSDILGGHEQQNSVHDVLLTLTTGMCVEVGLCHISCQSLQYVTLATKRELFLTHFEYCFSKVRVQGNTESVGSSFRKVWSAVIGNIN